jgi:hypothetical protein
LKFRFRGVGVGFAETAGSGGWVVGRIRLKRDLTDGRKITRDR